MNQSVNGPGPFNNRRFYRDFGRFSSPSEALAERNRRRAEGRRFVNEEYENRRERDAFITRVEKAAARNTQIDLQVFKDIIAAYDAEYLELAKKVEEGKNNPAAAAEAREMKLNLQQRVSRRIEHHGPAAQQAMNAIAQEQQPETFFTPIVRMFYDTDRGGVQFGSILGALGGGIAGYFGGNAVGLSGLLKWGLVALGTAVGTYAGSRLLPGEDTLNAPNLRTPMPQRPAPGHVRAPALGGPATGRSAEPGDDASYRTAMGGATLTNPGIRPATLTGSESEQFSPSGAPGAPGVRTRA